MTTSESELIKSLPYGTVIRVTEAGDFFVMAPGHSAGTIAPTIASAVASEFSCEYHGGDGWKHIVAMAREVMA